MTIFIVRWQKGAKGNEHNRRDANISEVSKKGGIRVLITKTVSKTYEVTFYPYVLPEMTWGEFRESREKNGINSSKFKKCFCCNHAFADDERVIVISVSSIGNRFACKACLDREKDGVNGVVYEYGEIR